jgi:hypothetical protein
MQTMIKMNHVFCLIILIESTCGICLSLSLNPIEIVNQFCEMDSNALRLDGRISGPMWKLTAGDGEPPAEPIYIISQFTTSEISHSENEVSIQVKYKIIGILSGEEPTKFQKISKEEKFTIYLIKSNSEWKIDISRLHISPHVYSNPLLHYFEGLLADTPKKDQYSSLRKDLENVISKLRACLKRSDFRK